MHYLEKLNTQKQELLKVEVLPPLSETLLESNDGKSIFNREIIENPNLQKEIKERKELIDELEKFYQKVPKVGTTIDEAISQEEISREETNKLLKNFELFFQNPDNRRALLYFPFELIPQKGLSKEGEKFRETYLQKWKELLPERDFRTNFINGDILEPELRSVNGLPEVSKASHLLPILLEKKLISMREIIELCENEKNTLIKESLCDTFGTALDMGLIREEDLNQMRNSSDSLIRNMAVILENIENNKNDENKNETKSSKELLDSIGQKIQKGILSIEEQSQHPSIKTKERIAWEKKRDISSLITKCAIDMREGILENAISIEELLTFGKSNIPTSALVVIEALRETVNSIEEPDIAKEMIKKYKSILEILGEIKDKDIQDAIENTWSTWKHKKYDDHYVKNILPKENTNLIIEAQEIRKYASLIENNEELKKYLYPALIMYGSKIKGYGTSRADTDIALFIKPGTDIKEREKIQNLVEKTFINEKMKDKPMEFWLKETGDHLEIIDFPDIDKNMSDSFMINVLWNGAWSGDKKTITELCNKLVAQYFKTKDKTVNGIPLRKILLKQLERDTLQYRLMHKGYHNLHAKEGGLNTPNSKDVDSESSFWDPGYRRLATRLFIEKVFLPNLEK